MYKSCFERVFYFSFTSSFIMFLYSESINSVFPFLTAWKKVAEKNSSTTSLVKISKIIFIKIIFTQAVFAFCWDKIVCRHLRTGKQKSCFATYCTNAELYLEEEFESSVRLIELYTKYWILLIEDDKWITTSLKLRIKTITEIPSVSCKAQI